MGATAVTLVTAPHARRISGNSSSLLLREARLFGQKLRPTSFGMEFAGITMGLRGGSRPPIEPVRPIQPGGSISVQRLKPNYPLAIAAPSAQIPTTPSPTWSAGFLRGWIAAPTVFMAVETLQLAADAVQNAPADDYDAGLRDMDDPRQALLHHAETLVELGKAKTKGLKAATQAFHASVDKVLTNTPVNAICTAVTRGDGCEYGAVTRGATVTRVAQREY
ncbi:hypothetical protein V500_06937 [Pseudogymnoascus sp. VKM F-4518 (FW-2643)]|nr:hypothetical protein V500_06937 [Pseudogymnoascus sp. VKM F-4518 (FW-2643)]